MPAFYFAAWSTRWTKQNAQKKARGDHPSPSPRTFMSFFVHLWQFSILDDVGWFTTVGAPHPFACSSSTQLDKNIHQKLNNAINICF